MYTPIYTKQFNKDIKRCQRRGNNFEKLKIIVRTLLSGETLDPIHKDHKLTGNYIGRRECHIESDWLLVYKYIEDSIVFERLGTHSDLFKK